MCYINNSQHALPDICAIDTNYKTCKWSGKGVSSLDMNGRQVRDERSREAKLVR